MRFSLASLSLTVGVLTANLATSQMGCLDPIACNYQPTAVTDDGSCFFPWYTLNGTTLVSVCELFGTELLGQDCVEQVIAADPFCFNNTWDSVCQSAYDECCTLGYSWFYPSSAVPPSPYNRMVIQCDAPDGYVELPTTTAEAIFIQYPLCFFNSWTTECDEWANTVVFGCANPQYWLPATPGFATPYSFGCSPQGNAFYPGNGFCAQTVLDNDPFCYTSWDAACQSAYSLCLTDCNNASWHVPIPSFDASLQPVFACETPEGYVELGPECLEFYIAFGYGYCFNGAWDSDCFELRDYCIAEESCGLNVAYQLPLPGIAPNTVPFPNCDLEAGYLLYNLGYAHAVFANDNSCFFSWDAHCWDILSSLEGCELGWNIPNPGTTGPPLFECPFDPNYTSVPTECFTEVVSADPFCLQNQWDIFCWEAINECLNGCTYPIACNYSPNAINDDQSCAFPGCTDPSALNYLAYAGCDDGTCVYDEGQSCTGDLNSDGVVNVTDLTTFLSVFGSSCND